MQSAGEITLVDSRELFDKVSNNEVVFVNGIEGVIPSMSISYEDWIKASVIENQLTIDEQQELYQAAEDSDVPTLRSIDDQRLMRLLDTMNQQINTFCSQQEKYHKLIQENSLIK